MPFQKNYADALVNRRHLFVAFTWFGSLAIFAGTEKYADFQNRFTCWMCMRSFGVSAVVLFLVKPGRVPPPIAYLFSLIAGFSCGYLLNVLISRLPFLHWAVLGIKKGKKRV